MSIKRLFVGALCAAPLCSMAMAAGIEGDEPSDAIVIGINETIVFNTNSYTATGGPVSGSQCQGTAFNWGASSQNEDIWFLFSPDEDQTLTFTTCYNGGYDTSMVLYENGFTNSSLVACNGDVDDQAGCQQWLSEIIYDVSAGMDYYVRIGGFQGAQGTAALTIETDPCEDVTKPQTFDVSSIAGMLEAIGSACDGDVIRLAAGTYDVNDRISLGGDAAVILEGVVGKGGELLTVLDGGGDTQIMFAGAPNMTVREMKFQNGRASGDGGAILCTGLGLIDSCVFVGNSSGLGGGAICFFGPQSTEAVNCSFRDNDAQYAGAVFHPQNSNTNPTSPTLRECEFLNNVATGTGGAVATGGSSPLYESCYFEANINQVTPPNNWNGFGGGALHFNAGGSPRVINCNIRDNSVAGGQCGGAIWAGGGVSCTIRDNVMCGNTCNGSVNHLSNTGGGSFNDQGGNELMDECMDEPEPCVGDLNGDGKVDSGDLGLLVAAWGTDGADVNGDGTTNSADLGLLIAAWGKCSTP